MCQINEYLNIGKSLRLDGFEYILHHSNYTHNELLGILNYLIHLKDIKSSDKMIYQELLQKYLCQVEIHDKAIGVLADTHIGNKDARWEMIHNAYDIFDRQNISTVFHLGDMMDGKYDNPYYSYQYSKGQCYRQIEQVTRLYPKDFTTYVLFGNHEYSFLQFGIDPVQELNSRNPSIQVLGYRSAYVKWRKKLIYLKHDIHKNFFCAPYHKNNDLVIRGHSHKYSYNYSKRILNVPTCSMNFPNKNSTQNVPGFLILKFGKQDIYMNYYAFQRKPSLILSKKL